MKQKTGLLTLLAIAVTVCLFVLTGKRVYERSHPAPPPAALKSGDETTAAPPSTSGSLLSLKKMISAPIRHENTEMARMSPACSVFEDSLFALSLGDLEYPPKAERLPTSEGCLPANPKLAKLLNFYQTKCTDFFQKISHGSLPKEKWEEKFGECQLATMFLRSTLAGLARAQKPLAEISDMRELADLLVTQFGSLFMNDVSADGAAQIRAIADRMAELDGHLLPAVKAGAMGAMLENLTKQEKAKESGERVDWSDMEKRMADVTALSPNDPDLDSLHRIVDTEGMNPDLVKKDSASRLSKNPNDWREHEMMAWANFRQGRRDEAKTSLARARALDPGNTELNFNWAVVNRPNSKPDDFKISMKVGVGFTDLLQ